MATGQSLIDRALRLIGQIPSGESGTPAESADALISVNAMLDSWRNEKLMCYSLQEESLTLSASDPSYTLGPAGDLVTTRPVAIEAAWILDNGQTYDVKIIEDDVYAAIPDKSSESSWPNVVNYRPTMPTGTLYVHPLPDATRTLKMLTRTPVAALTLVGTVALPPGWEEAIASHLAIRLAPEYETTPSAEVRQMAKESKAGIKGINSKPINGGSELAALVNRPMRNIISG